MDYSKLLMGEVGKNAFDSIKGRGSQTPFHGGAEQGNQERGGVFWLGITKEQ